MHRINIAFWMCAALCATATAQDCILSGRVVHDYDPTKGLPTKGIESVAVRVMDGNNMVGAQASGKNGSFCFQALPPGSFTLVHRLKGYSPDPGMSQVVIKQNQKQVVDLLLKPLEESEAELQKSIQLFYVRAEAARSTDKIWMAGTYSDMPTTIKIKFAKQAVQDPQFTSLPNSDLLKMLANSDPASLGDIDAKLQAAIEGKGEFPKSSSEISTSLFGYTLASKLVKLSPPQRNAALEKFKMSNGKPDISPVLRWTSLGSDVDKFVAVKLDVSPKIPLTPTSK